MRTYNINITTKEVSEVSDNELIQSAVESVIQEAVSHFNKVKRSVKYPEEDCRFFWNDTELTIFLKQITYPDKIWVSTIKDDHGNFYAYRVGRVCINKKKGIVKY